MKSRGIFSLVLLAGLLLAGVAAAQSPKDLYKSVKRAELSAGIRASKSFKDSLTEAKTEFDLFKGSDEAKKNPEFAKHIEAAIDNIQKAYGLSWAMDHGFHGKVNKNPVSGSSGVESIDNWNRTMGQAKAELEAAKKYLK